MCGSGSIIITSMWAKDAWHRPSPKPSRRVVFVCFKLYHVVCCVICVQFFVASFVGGFFLFRLLALLLNADTQVKYNKTISHNYFRAGLATISGERMHFRKLFTFFNQIIKHVMKWPFLSSVQNIAHWSLSYALFSPCGSARSTICGCRCEKYCIQTLDSWVALLWRRPVFPFKIIH